MGRRRKRGRTNDAESAPQRPSSKGARLEALLCGHCGAPLPVGDDDAARCRACGTATALPADYKAMRDAHRLSAEDAAQLERLCAEISRPPPFWERVAVVVGYGIGILTVVVVALGALVGAIGGLFVSAKLDAGETATKVIVGMGVVFCGFVSVPLAGEWLIAFASQLDATKALDLAFATRAHAASDLGVAAVLYFLGVVPIAVAWRTSQSISKLEELQARLAAQPPATPDGVSTCRQCGAPLDVRPGALGTRCIYCGADNLLSVPEAYAKKTKADARAIDREVQAEVTAWTKTKAQDRRTMWLLLAAGLSLAPLICAGGWLLHKTLSP